MERYWCLVADGAVLEGPRFLPRAWRNVSNFYTLDDGTLHGFGWLLYRSVAAPDGKIVSGSFWTLSATEAVKTETWRDKTQAELDAEREALADEVRAERKARLDASDWTQLPDAPVNAASWAAYRQELRNVPQQSGFPESVIWPTQPA